MTTKITLTKPESNLFNKLVNDYGLVISKDDTLAKNMCSGHCFQTNSPESAALVRFLNAVYLSYSMFGKMYFNNKPVAVGTYDRTKYLLLKIDRDTYMNVID